MFKGTKGDIKSMVITIRQDSYGAMLILQRKILIAKLIKFVTLQLPGGLGCQFRVNKFIQRHNGL